MPPTRLRRARVTIGTATDVLSQTNTSELARQMEETLRQQHLQQSARAQFSPVDTWGVSLAAAIDQFDESTPEAFEDDEMEVEEIQIEEIISVRHLNRDERHMAHAPMKDKKKCIDLSVDDII